LKIQVIVLKNRTFVNLIHKGRKILLKLIQILRLKYILYGQTATAAAEGLRLCHIRPCSGKASYLCTKIISYFLLTSFPFRSICQYNIKKTGVISSHPYHLKHKLELRNIIHDELCQFISISQGIIKSCSFRSCHTYP